MNDRPVQQPVAAVRSALGVHPERDLAAAEVAARRSQHGANVLESSGRTSTWPLFARQCRDTVTLVSLVAAALAFYLDDVRGGAILVAIVLVRCGNMLSHRSRRTLFGACLFDIVQMWQAPGTSLTLVLIIVNVPAIARRWFGFEPMRAVDRLWPVDSLAAFIAWFDLKKAWLHPGGGTPSAESRPAGSGSGTT